MTRLSAGLIVLAALLTAPALAQVSVETELAVEVLNEEWDAIVEHSLELTSEERAAFWPAYEEYRGQMKVLLGATKTSLSSSSRPRV